MTNIDIVIHAESIIHDPEKTAGMDANDISLIGDAIRIARNILQEQEDRQWLT